MSQINFFSLAFLVPKTRCNGLKVTFNFMGVNSIFFTLKRLLHLENDTRIIQKYAIFSFWAFYGTLQQLSFSGSLKCYRRPVQCWEGSFELLSARKTQKSFLDMMQEDFNESQRERWTGTQKGPLILFNPRKSPTASFLKRSIASSVVSSLHNS